MPVIILGTGDMMMNKTEKDSCPHGAYVLLKGEREKLKGIE